MEVSWLLVLLLLCVSFLIIKSKAQYQRLPPGPLAVPFFGNLLWLPQTSSNIESILHDLHTHYGPIISLRMGSRLLIFISDRHLAHSALITYGATFASRPTQTAIREILTVNYHTISSAKYGSLWRLLRRNLAGEFLHPSRVKFFSLARKWTTDLLKEKLSCCKITNDNAIIETFQFSMFSLLIYMCFGKRLEEDYVKQIKSAERDSLLYNGRKLNIFACMPMVTKHLYRKRWKTALNLRKRLKGILLPLIEARRELNEKIREGNSRNEHKILEYCYVDTLLDIRLPDEGGRSLIDDELIALCSEFLIAGTDTTSTTLEWIMAELVKNQQVQLRLWDEIKLVLSNNNSEDIEEGMLEKMPYLKAVVLEALRRHPPVHLLLHHAVTEDFTLGGYVIPKEAWVSINVANIGMDKEVWDNPTEFKPERFLEGGEGVDVDITGTKEIKMMPFGAGRRICSGLGIAMLHLEYFVANLVKEFEWKGIEGDEVDFAEKAEFTVVMKKPLRAHLVQRK
ncbi:hypothetical protein LUZ63_010910 [Rhynchospora breviuscula]|uniref:Cytochrome P450 n=1 Tax=Rhynchospora breviuscula TaxID=2022672 RepID=A0A9Q0HQ33_9POAL|nr:hypothetical protein LUZ63_010910 [Rhynchospora breviuscula]